MKKVPCILTTLILFFLSNSIVAQSRYGHWCGSADAFEEAMKNNPEFIQNQRNLEAFTEQYALSQNHSNSLSQKKSSVVRTIPVVVHVIHANGTENISKAQIVSQIDALNRDFRRLNSDTSNTPAPFKSIAADCEIEFKMAQLDPNGNCTDGINRIYSPLTIYARNNVKSLISWPTNKYLNIWIVKSIRRSDGSLPPAGTIIAGFAQFPGGSSATDGIVVASANFGTVGTSLGNTGRTTVHEVGHWLNLRHIWGDDNGLCSGSDFVTDTPNQASENFSTCPTFPLLDACSPSGNGILFSNYMDYTSELCQNIYTVGQSTRMNAALSSTISNRNNLWSSANLVSTGLSTPSVLCEAKFSTNVFGNVVCENSFVTFSDVSYNGAVTSRQWSFPGATLVAPSLATDSVVTVQYPVAGQYAVSLTVSNAGGSVSTTQANFIKVLANTASYNGNFYSESFESSTLPNSDWEVVNLDSDLQQWQQTTSTAFSGNASAFLENFSADSADVDELMSPTFNGQAIPSIGLNFQVAFARKSASDNDALKIWTSIDCGRTWSLRSTISAATLAGSNPIQTTYFTPTSSTQWHKETVSVANLANRTNARIKFQFISGNGNNIYLDDINLISPLGRSDMDLSASEIQLLPNPSKENRLLQLNLKESGSIDVTVFSAIGERVETAYSGFVKSGKQLIEIGKSTQLAAGIYFVKVKFDSDCRTLKMLIE
jgi:PKD repeat protein